MNIQRNQPNAGDFDKKQQEGPPKKPKVFNWTSILQILIIWIFIFYFMQLCSSKNRSEIAYTAFKAQLEKGNIASVTVKGDQVSGQFKDAYEIIRPAQDDTLSLVNFTTTLPSFEDPALMSLLEEKSVTIRAESTEDTWSNLLILLLPWILIIGFFYLMARRAQGRFQNMYGGIFKFNQSRAKRYKKSQSSVRFDDVAGLENAKLDLKEISEFLKNPERFTELGAEIPKGILLVGPPGTGKTMLARAVAGEADVPFYSISGSEFIEMFVGVGASRVRDLFENAKKEAPAVIFVDEIDSIGRARGTGLGGGHDEREQTLNQILAEMDGFEKHDHVIVLAATNRPDVLDTALTRPGRFDRHITLDLPRKAARKKILEIHARDKPLAEAVDFERIAAKTVGFSGADLKNLMNEAALLAGRRGKKQIHTGDISDARDKIVLGNEREERMTDDEKKVVAYHEAGHVLLAALLSNADPLEKVTIIPRGKALGITEQIPDVERFNPGRKYLLDRMTIMLGGRSAEKLMFDEITSGAANDLKQVTRMARKMVCQWGMSKKIGPVYYNREDEHPFLGREMTQPRDFSEDTARLIDEEVRKMITGLQERAQSVLEEHRNMLKKLAEALFEQESLDKSQIREILNEAASGDFDDIDVREALPEIEV